MSLVDFFPARTIEPEPYQVKPVGKRICTFDSETDPFKEGCIVRPFTCGFYDTETQEYFDFWGDDCIEQFFEFLDANYSEIECVIYAHNGGNFDFYFCLDQFDDNSKVFIKNGRLSQIFMHGQEFRDSYDCVPVPMDKYKKTRIRYRIFERDARERPYFKRKIRSYQKDDCVFLSELVVTWLNDFGNRLTMAGVALPMLKSYHGFECVNEKTDDLIRDYYFGGRVQCFESGILNDDWKVYDVNSMYPSVMASYSHPVSAVAIPQTSIDRDTMFARITADSDGALPLRLDTGGLSFPRGKHDFYACIHEINAGIETGLLEVLEVHEAYRFEVKSNFAAFVHDFYERRMKARVEGDTIHDIFFKLVINSSYGKFAQDPRKYETYLFNPDDIPQPFRCEECYGRLQSDPNYEHCGNCRAKRSSPFGWYIHTIRDGKIIWARPQRRGGRTRFFNVATAASITSAARAELLKGIAKSVRPIYCDTDSIICRSLDLPSHPDLLGAWKLEASGDTAAIAGKKLYAVFDQGREIKKASKGVRLTAQQIARVAAGEVIEYSDPVPKFHLDGSADIDRKRTIRNTAGL